MARLFVDVDDTLILWDVSEVSRSGLYQMDGYKINDALRTAVIKAVNADPDLQLYIWSGGGVDYAAMWAGRVFGGGLPWRALSKDINIPMLDDVCIDDQPIQVSGTLLTWQQFVDRKEELSLSN